MRLLQAQRSHSQIKMQFKTEEIVAQLHDELEGWLYKFNPHIDKKDRSGLRYASFVVEYGSQLALSAADHVHIIWAHLTDAAAVTACTQQLAGFWCAAPDVGVAMCDRFLPVSRAAVEVEWTVVQFACLQATVQPCGCDVSTFVAPHQAEPLATHPRHFLLLPSSPFLCRCRNAYKATDVRSEQVAVGLERAKAQLRQLAQDASVADPTAEQNSLITHGRGGPGYCLDLSTHRGFAATSPLVRPRAAMAPRR